MYTLSLSSPCLCTHYHCLLLVYVHAIIVFSLSMYTLSLSSPCLCTHYHCLLLVYVHAIIVFSLSMYTLSLSSPCLCTHYHCLLLVYVHAIIVFSLSMYTLSLSSPCLCTHYHCLLLVYVHAIIVFSLSMYTLSLSSPCLCTHYHCLLIVYVHTIIVFSLSMYTLSLCSPCLFTHYHCLLLAHVHTIIVFSLSMYMLSLSSPYPCTHYHCLLLVYVHTIIVFSLSMYTLSLSSPCLCTNYHCLLLVYVHVNTISGCFHADQILCECELNRRIAVAKNNFAKMSRILADHDMTLATKIRLAQCYVWSTLLYGCETWSLTQTHEMKLRGHEMWMYRRIGRVSWKAKKTNKEVLNKLGLQSTKLMTVVRQRIVKFYGHVRRHDSLQRIITEGMVNGKRGRGRKRSGWLGNVSRYAGMNINICRNERKQMRRNCYQQGRIEDHSIQRCVRQETAVR